MSDDVLEIFNEAAEIADALEREAFLEKACGDDGPLRRKVEDLLGAHHELGDGSGFLGGGGDGAEGSGTPGGWSDDTGGQVGRYKLLQKIGEGGWGIVYMAEQTEPVRRRVALKIIKPGMDTRQVMARFEAERQALGGAIKTDRIYTCSFRYANGGSEVVWGYTHGFPRRHFLNIVFHPAERIYNHFDGKDGLNERYEEWFREGEREENQNTTEYWGRKNSPEVETP